MESTVHSQALAARIEKAFGVVPNFFLVAEQSPKLVEELLGFAQFAYLDAPMPSLFKEKIFAYLSRFCEVPYCVARHVGFLLGKGHVAGDRTAAGLNLQQVFDLLNEPPPDSTTLIYHFSRLRDLPPSTDGWPEPGGEAESHVFACAVGVFLKTGNQASTLSELRRYLGDILFNRLVLLMSFVSFAHTWAESHPEIVQDSDVSDLLKQHHSLQQWIMEYRDRVANELADHTHAERLRLRSLQDRLKSELIAINRMPATLTHATDPRDVLSERELETFELIGRGQSTRQIAAKMELSSKTIETYRARLKIKLGIQTMPELAMEATAWVLRTPGTKPD